MTCWRARGAGAASPAGGLRRRLDAGGGGGGLRRRAGLPAQRDDWSVLERAGGQVAGAGWTRRGDEVRYRLLETVRQYAAERLAEAGEEARRADRHLAWCLALAERRSRS